MRGKDKAEKAVARLYIVRYAQRNGNKVAIRDMAVKRIQ